MRRFVVLVVLFSALVPTAVWAAATEVLFFYEEGCPHCARMTEVLDELATTTSGFSVERLEIGSFEARDLLPRLLTAYGAEVGPVPLIFVGDVAIVGGTLYAPGQPPVALSGRSEELALRDAVAKAVQSGAPSPLSRLPSTKAELVLFTAPDCPDCFRLEELVANLVARYPELGVTRHVLGVADSDALFGKLLRLFDARGKAPALFVGDMAIVEGRVYTKRQAGAAFTYSGEDVTALEAVVDKAIAAKAGSPLDKLRVREKATLWAVIGAAALDSINPCDFAVMILLLGRLLVIGRRGKVLWAGLAFAAAIYLMYFLMGFVVYTILGASLGTRGLRSGYILAVSCIAILMGLWQMKDLMWYGKWFSIEVPERWKPKVKRVTDSVFSVPGVFVAGLIDALFLAPCTSGPYIAILSLLSQTTSRLQGVLLLLLYNLIFVLPLIAIATTVHLGFTTTARAERWRTARTGKLHFVSGLVMLLLGVGMIVGLQLGYI